MNVKPATKIGSYFNERGKLREGEPMFSREALKPGDEIMIYDYDLGKHVRAVITGSIVPEMIEFEIKHNKQQGTYSAKKAHELVPKLQLPHVYMAP